MSNTKEIKPAPELHDFAVEFRKYKTELTKKFKERKKWEPKDESKLLSYIPGTITELFVKEGQHVEEGEALLVLEAMKMKNTIFAERSGKIIAIHVHIGDKVPKAKVMFEMDLD